MDLTSTCRPGRSELPPPLLHFGSMGLTQVVHRSDTTYPLRPEFAHNQDTRCWSVSRNAVREAMPAAQIMLAVPADRVTLARSPVRPHLGSDAPQGSSPDVRSGQSLLFVVSPTEPAGTPANRHASTANLNVRRSRLGLQATVSSVCV